MSVEVLRALGVQHSGWMTLDADRVRAFADATEDWQFIHLDPVRAAETPFGQCVAHGFLTLSMLSAMSYQVVPDLPGVRSSVNYGFDRIRFVAPVPVGARVRGRFDVARVEAGPGWIAAHWDVTVEIEDAPKPALVAQWITRFYTEDAAPRT